MLFEQGYKAKPISKSIISELLKFSESYEGDMKLIGKELNIKYGEKLNNPAYLNRLSGIYLRSHKINYVIPITELNTQLFPNDGNVWDTMGDVYFASNQKEKAIYSYKKALELKPQNDDCFWCDNSITKLKSLRANK